MNKSLLYLHVWAAASPGSRKGGNGSGLQPIRERQAMFENEWSILSPELCGGKSFQSERVDSFTKLDRILCHRSHITVSTPVKIWLSYLVCFYALCITADIFNRQKQGFASKDKDQVVHYQTFNIVIVILLWAQIPTSHWLLKAEIVCLIGVPWRFESYPNPS